MAGQLVRTIVILAAVVGGALAKDVRHQHRSSLNWPGGLENAGFRRAPETSNFLTPATGRHAIFSRHNEAVCPETSDSVLPNALESIQQMRPICGRASPWAELQSGAPAGADILSTMTSDRIPYTSHFSGKDIGARVQAAYDALPTAGGLIIIDTAGPSDWTTPVNITKPVRLMGLGKNSTLLQINAPITPITIKGAYVTLEAFNLSRKMGFGGRIPNIVAVKSCQGCRFRDLTLAGADVAAINLDNFTDAVVDSLVLHARVPPTGRGLQTDGSSFVSTTLTVRNSSFMNFSEAIDLRNTVDVTSDSNIFIGNLSAIKADKGTIIRVTSIDDHVESSNISGTYLLWLNDRSQRDFMLIAPRLEGDPRTSLLKCTGSAVSAQVRVLGFD